MTIEVMFYKDLIALVSKLSKLYKINFESNSLPRKTISYNDCDFSYYSTVALS